MLKKIVSGGQTGADQNALVAAKYLGLETGGYCPIGWKTDSGSAKNLLQRYGLVEFGVGYRPRTIKNVKESNATLWIGNQGSPGGQLTLGQCVKQHKIFLVNPSIEELKLWITAFDISVLNVAGNRERTNPGIGRVTYNLLVGSLEEKG